MFKRVREIVFDCLIIYILSSDIYIFFRKSYKLCICSLNGLYNYKVIKRKDNM